MFNQPSAIGYLVMLLLAPLAVGAVITLVGLAPSWRKRLDAPAPSTEIERADS
jgi:hypothetical protein